MSLNDAPLLATPLYGLRTWSVDEVGGAELLAGPHRLTPWPPHGTFIEATCAPASGHEPPGKGCNCGLHAWHPSRRSARRVLALRREIPGLVEAQGAIEVHEDGFRTQRARPSVLFLAPRRNARLLQRLAEAYGAEVVEVHGAEDVLSFCRARGLGLDPATVARLLGPRVAEERRRAKRARARRDGLRLGAVVVAATLLVIGGLRFATDPPGERVLNGRTGEIRINSR